MVAFLDTSVLLTTFGTARVSGTMSPLFSDPAPKLTFEKCIYEAYLAFRGIGGKKPDEGRGDWAQRYLTVPDDPVPLGEAAGRIHGGSLLDAHYWVGQADEAQWATWKGDDGWESEVHSSLEGGDWAEGGMIWRTQRAAVDNHRRYERLCAEFRAFLKAHEIRILSYEEIYRPESFPFRIHIMNGISERSTIPSEDFEIVVAALLSGARLFVTADRRLLNASYSIEQNCRFCEFVHLNDAVRLLADATAQD